MLPELIYREEKLDSFSVLLLLGFSSVLLGFGFAKLMRWESQVSLLTVIFAAIPLIYPLTSKFLDDEESDSRPHLEEAMIYGTLFLGEVAGFVLVSALYPSDFSLQMQQAGISGNATSLGFFAQIFPHNLRIFTGIFLVSALIGSAGAFILVWNASVLGVFLPHLVRENPFNAAAYFACSRERIVELGLENAGPVCYLPHAAFEMTGFIIAGLTGSLVSGAVYRKHFDRETWLDYFWLLLAGFSAILIGASLESGVVSVFLGGLLLGSLCVYRLSSWSPDTFI